MAGCFYFFILFIIPGAVSSFLVEKMLKNRTEFTVSKLQFIRMFGFFTLTFYSVFRLLKMFGNRGEQGYFETIDQMSIKSVANSYLYSVIVFFLIAILICYVLKEEFIYVAEICLMLNVLMLVCTFVLSGVFLDNKSWGLCYLAVGIVSVIFYVALKYVLKKKLIFISTKDDLIKRCKFAIPIDALWLLLMYIVLPLEMYINNSGEIPVSVKYYLTGGTFSFLISFVVILLSTVFALTEKSFWIVNGFVFCITVLGYIQELFLNGNMKLLTDSIYSWNMTMGVINLIIWIVVLIIGCYGVYKSERVKKYIPGLATFIIAIRVISVLVLAITTKISDNAVLLKTDSMVLNDKSNVIVFVLDSYDTQNIDKVIEEDPSFFSPLLDFTYYDNLSSKYAYTYMAVPYLLTGVDWTDGQTEQEYRDEAFEKGTFIKDIKNQNYSIGVYSEEVAVGPKIKDYIVNYSDMPEYDFDYDAFAKLMMQSSKYLTMPIMFKGSYIYETRDYYSLILSDDTWHINDDLEFWRDLHSEGLSVGDEGYEGAFRFIHMGGTHLDFYLNEDMEYIGFFTDVKYLSGQAKAAMKIVYEYLNQMKVLGVYDNSTIIITADHGQNFSIDHLFYETAAELETEYDLPSSPILFVKKPYEHNNEMPISHVPATQANLIETMREATGAVGDGTVKCLEELGNDDNPKREIIVYNSKYIPKITYEITGNIREADNWKEK